MNASRQLPLPLPKPPPSYAREDFLARPCNASALALVDAWPNWPAPLMLIAGPPGSGKSHLAAIFAARAGVRRQDGGALESLDADAATRAPALALDDADRVGAAEAALFHLLNFARARGVPALLTAKAAPDFWGLATPDLLSRLRLAPIIEIAPPEPELIEAVLLKLFSDRQMTVEPTLAAFAARRLDRSLDAARAFVDALDAEALAQGRKATRAMAAPFLAAESD